MGVKDQRRRDGARGKMGCRARVVPDHIVIQGAIQFLKSVKLLNEEEDDRQHSVKREVLKTDSCTQCRKLQ